MARPSSEVRTPVVAAIDFGTTCTGYAYAIRKGGSHQLNDITEVGPIAPTTVLMKPDETFHSFGCQAESRYNNLCVKKDHLDWYYFRHFKMKLHHEKVLTRDMLLEDVNGKTLKALTIFTEAIRYVMGQLLNKVNEATKETFKARDITWVITVPAIWTYPAKQFMQEAAVKAGIPADLILLALEPEAAAIYCKEQAIQKTKGVQGVFLRAFDPGEKYVVLDLGGGTADTTVHEVLGDGKLKELHAATGGAWGGMLVNSAFEDFIQKLVGYDVFKEFCDSYPSHWIALQNSFETEKKKFPETSEEIVFNFPTPLSDSYKRVTSMSLSKRLENLNCHTQLMENQMMIQPEQMKTFFSEAVQQINVNIQQLLDMEHLRKVNYILLVGGFSESSFVKEGIQKNFRNKRVIAPAAPSEATLKGAVMYGTNTDIIASRISPYSYGVQTRAFFNPKIHPANKKKKVGEKYVVDNAFDKHIEMGQSIQVGDATKALTYKVTNTKDKNVYWNVYKSTSLKDPGVCSAVGCTKIGRLSITIPGDIKDDTIGLELKMICKGTELEAIARTVQHPVNCHATFDFLGLEDEVAGDMLPEKL